MLNLHNVDELPLMKHTIGALWLAASGTTIVAMTLMVVLSYRPWRDPDFVLRDPDSTVGMAFYLEHSVLKKHGVTVGEFRRAFDQPLEELGKLIAKAVVEDGFFGGDSKACKDPVQLTDEKLSMPSRVFCEIHNSMIVEEWSFGSDGTGRLLKRLNQAKLFPPD